MEKFDFSAATFETIEGLVYPLIKTLFGFDVANEVGSKAEIFTTVGDGFQDIADLFHAAGKALEDGILTAEEIGDIITKALTVKDAIAIIKSKFSGDSEVTPPAGV